MIKNLILLLALVTSPTLLGQINQNELLTGVEKNKNPEKLDSIAKTLNLKGGDLIAVYAMFTVNEKGEITNVIAKASHPAFEEEAIRIIKELPRMDPAIVNGQPVSRRFSLPIKFRIETEKEKKKRLKREKKKSREIQ